MAPFASEEASRRVVWGKFTSVNWDVYIQQPGAGWQKQGRPQKQWACEQSEWVKRGTMENTHVPWCLYEAAPTRRQRARLSQLREPLCKHLCVSHTV